MEKKHTVDNWNLLFRSACLYTGIWRKAEIFHQMLMHPELIKRELFTE